jgi:hypothetical protein
MLARGERWLNAEKDSIWQRRWSAPMPIPCCWHVGAPSRRPGSDPVPPTDEDVFKKTYPKFIWGKAGENTMWLFAKIGC